MVLVDGSEALVILIEKEVNNNKWKVSFPHVGHASCIVDLFASRVFYSASTVFSLWWFSDLGISLSSSFLLSLRLDPPPLLHPNQLPHLRLLSTETPRIEAPHQYYNIYKKRAPNPQRIRQISNGSRRI